jgi:exopolysaccharide biosynthesis polyprenyl glycosylphosphotransferase
MSARHKAPASITAAVSAPKVPSLSLKNQRLILKLWLLAADAVALGMAFRVAYWFRFDIQVTLAPEVVPNPEFYPHLAALLIPVWILVFLLFNLYDPELKFGGIAEYSRTFNACTTGTVLVVVATFILTQFIVSRLWLISAWMLSFLLVSLHRFLGRRVLYSLRGRWGYFLTPAVIVGTNEEAAMLVAHLGEWRSSGLRILGFVSGQTEDSAINGTGLPVLGSTREILEIVEEYGVEDLIVAITAVNREELLELGEEVNPVQGIHLRLSSGLYEILTTGVTVKTLGTVPLVSVNKVRLEPEEVYVKGLLDYSVTIAALLLSWPFLLVIALLIRMDSRGPVIHRRRVLGVSGRQFDAFKFRTMHVNGNDMLKGNPELERALRANHKLKEDPRVTRVGRWLRRYSLDEVPQLFNVLLGQMSLVGPRMISPEEADKYGRHKLNLLTVKPGITGLWQVSGRSDLTYDERVRLDMYYVRNYSVWLDLQIFFIQTIPAVIRGRGAY